MTNFFFSLTRSFNRFNRPIGLDLGSSRTRIWVEGKGLVLDQPSLIAVDQANQRVVAVGEAASKIRGRAEASVQVLAPVQAPKLTDSELVKAMLKLFLRELSDQVYYFSPTMVVALPSSFYPVMRQELTKILVELGASEVIVIDQTLAAAIGAGVPVAEAAGAFVLQLGAKVVEAAGLSLGKVVAANSSSQAGEELCQEIIYWFAWEKELKISLSIAEKVLQRLGSLSTQVQQRMNVTGLDLKVGGPKERVITSSELLELMTEYGEVYLQLIKDLLTKISPDLTVDVIDRGLLLSGGLGQLHGLDDFLTQQLKMPVFVVDEPELSVIQGIGVVLGQLDEYRQSLGYGGG